MARFISKILFVSSILQPSISNAYTYKGTGKLVSCVSPKNLKRGKVCTIRLKKPIKRVPKGTIVSAYNKRGYWQSSGTIYAMRGVNLVVIFRNNLRNPDKDGFFRLASVYDNYDWESAFDKNGWF
ncbi:MAG: hypothetical protein HRU09_20450 [Oligoflexales bacterium]|nr:hypothetical protein [Oligoflexales bacterium]